MKIFERNNKKELSKYKNKKDLKVAIPEDIGIFGLINLVSGCVGFFVGGKINLINGNFLARVGLGLNEQLHNVFGSAFSEIDYSFLNGSLCGGALTLGCTTILTSAYCVSSYVSYQYFHKKYLKTEKNKQSIPEQQKSM